MTIAPEVPRNPTTPPHERRFRRVALGLVVAVALAVSGIAAWGGRQTREVPVPGPSASPRQVVLAYLDALDARDCDAQQRLWSGGDPPGREGCRDTASITDVRLLDQTTTGDGQPLLHLRYQQRMRLFHGSTTDSDRDVAFTVHRVGSGAWRITRAEAGDG